MKLKKLKDQTGEELIWSDYLSLPFTQTVCQSYNVVNFTLFLKLSIIYYANAIKILLSRAQVITETLRLGNIINGVMRKAMKDVQIKGGYVIPKGWCVFTYFRSVHLDENLYDSPHKFNPWRWQVCGSLYVKKLQVLCT